MSLFLLYDQHVHSLSWVFLISFDDCGHRFLAINFTLASMCDFSSDVLADPVKGNEIAELFSPKWNKLLSSDCISETGLPLTEYIQLDDEALKSN